LALKRTFLPLHYLFSKKAGERKTAGKTPGLSPAPTRFSRQFVFSIRFSDYLGAWNRLKNKQAMLYLKI